MKKIALVLSIMASAMVLASCASKGPVEEAPAQTAAPTAHHHHHDYKGEVK